MNRFLLFSFCHLFFSSSFAQYSNRIWCFGDSAGIDFSDPSNPTTFVTSMDCRGSCASIADSNNQLLFYAHTGDWNLWSTAFGCYCAGRIENKNHATMLNGDSLIGDIVYDQILIIPFGNDSTKFYVFHLSTTVLSYIFYSVVDMTLGGGNGGVVQKNIPIDTALYFSGSASYKHGNGRDWWILFRPSNVQVGGPSTNDLYLFLVTPTGIQGPNIQNVGSLNSTDLGAIRFSHNGTKIAFVNEMGLVEIYDFDRCTGIISNPMNIAQEVSGFPFPYTFSVEFSPNDSILFVSTMGVEGKLLQYDLFSADIPASEIEIASITYPAYLGGALKLAPDNKIYWSYAWDHGTFNYPYTDSIIDYNLYNMNLSVINNPNMLGTACDFQPFSFYLGGKRTYYGLPNNPDYNQPAWGGSICDTLGLPNAVPNFQPINSGQLHVFYHPDWQTAFINGEGLMGKNYSLHVVDVSGKEVFKENGSLSSAYYTRNLQCEKFSKGAYLVLLVTERERLVKRFVID